MSAPKDPSYRLTTPPYWAYDVAFGILLAVVAAAAGAAGAAVGFGLGSLVKGLFG